MDIGEEAEIDKAVRKYFSDIEWQTMPDMLKKRHLNVYQNYINFPIGVEFAPIPDYIQKWKNRNKTTRGNKNEKKKRNCKNNENEFKPGVQKIVQNAGVQFAPIKGYNQKCKKLNRTDVGNKNGKKKRKCNKEENEFKPSKSVQKIMQNSCVKRYPKRNKALVNYLEPEIPKDDRYVFCDRCEMDYIDFCPNCGMLVALKDIPVPLGMKNRARKTLPNTLLEIKSSKIHGEGVFALKKIPMGLQMGPYEGEFTRVDSTHGYSWRLKDGRLVDAKDESKSNWLRFVNCARHSNEQNLVAFQYNGGLYYRTSRTIQEDKELLVYYGNSFAKHLGVDVEKYFQPTAENIASEVFGCDYCFLGFSHKAFKDQHLPKCSSHPDNIKLEPTEIFICQYCGIALSSEKYRKRHEPWCTDKLKVISRVQKITTKSKEDVTRKLKYTFWEYGTENAAQLPRNVLLHEKVTEKKYCCQNCTYSTSHRGNFSNHKRIHEKLKMFVCKVCKKGFNEKAPLNIHMCKYHPGTCDELFLKKHKSYKCYLCSYITFAIGNYKRHKLRHNKENAEVYECDKCAYRTYYKSRLIQHVDTHSAVRKFKCKICNYGCSRQNYLKSHVYNKHPESCEE